jgi:phage shock protein A
MGSNEQILDASIAVVNLIDNLFNLVFLPLFFIVVIAGLGVLIFIIITKIFLLQLPLYFWIFLLTLSSPTFLLIPRLTHKKNLKNEAESLHNIQEKAVLEIQNDLDNIRQNINTYTTNKINLEQQHEEAQKAAKTWQQRVVLAIQQGEEVLASEALSHHQRYTDTAVELKTKLEELTIQIDSLQWDLRTHERKLVLAELELAQIKAAEAESKQAQLMASTKHNTNITLTVRSILNFFAGRAKDTALLQEQSVIDMDEELAALCRELTKVTESQKYFQQEYEKAQRKADEWQQKAQSFLQVGDEQQASEALSQQQYYSDIALEWKVQLDKQTVKVDSLKHNLSNKQRILAVAKAERDILKLRKRYHKRF